MTGFSRLASGPVTQGWVGSAGHSRVVLVLITVRELLEYDYSRARHPRFAGKWREFWVFPVLAPDGGIVLQTVGDAVAFRAETYVGDPALLAKLMQTRQHLVA